MVSASMLSTVHSWGKGACKGQGNVAEGETHVVESFETKLRLAAGAASKI